MRRYWVTLGVLAALPVLPALSAVIADWIIKANGCSFDMKSGTVCIIGGSDWGPVLDPTVLTSWVLLPAALLLSGVGAATWTVVLIVHRLIWIASKGRIA